MAILKINKNCTFVINGKSMSPESGEFSVPDEQARGLSELDGIEVIKYDEFTVNDVFDKANDTDADTDHDTVDLKHPDSYVKPIEVTHKRRNKRSRKR